MLTVSIGVWVATNEIVYGDKPVWFYSHEAVMEEPSDLNLKAHWNARCRPGLQRASPSSVSINPT